MPTMIRRLPLAALVAIVIVAGVEATAWQLGRQSPFVKRLEMRLSRLLDRPVIAPVANNQAFDSRYYDSHNPFFNQPNLQTFMPFVGIAGATGSGGYTPDYFGFRNHLGDKVYFSPHRRPLIVMTGNSELAGIHHPKISPHCLRMNCAAAAWISMSSISAPIRTAWPLKSALTSNLETRPARVSVIAHSGGIEYQYGMVVPANFRWLGLAYHPPLEEWAYRMYNMRDYTGPSVWRQRDPSARLDETVAATELLLNQYRSIVERNGKTIFLFGAQKIGPTHGLFPFWTKETRDEFMQNYTQRSTALASTIFGSTTIPK